MPCYDPRHLFITYTDPLTKKKTVKVTSNDIDCLWTNDTKINSATSWIPYKSSKIKTSSIVDVNSNNFRHVIDNYVDIPCGKCIGCLQKKQSDMAIRMQLESLDFNLSTNLLLNEVWFLTLTYSPEYLPCEYTDIETGEVVFFRGGNPRYNITYKPDVQNFIKRLRKNNGKGYNLKEGFKYYATLEYGSNTHRCHAHLILFGISFSDIEPVGFRNGNNYYSSASLLQRWSVYLGNDIFNNPIFDSLGMIVLAPANDLTFQYVAKYSAKDSEGCKHLQSCKPAIGRNFFNNNLLDLDSDVWHSIWNDSKIIVKDGDVVVKGQIPRYYIRLFKSHVIKYDSELKKSIYTDELVFPDLCEEWFDYCYLLEDILSAQQSLRMQGISISWYELLESEALDRESKVNLYRQTHNLF